MCGRAIACASEIECDKKNNVVYFFFISFRNSPKLSSPLRAVNVVAKETVTFACVAINVNPEADIRWSGIDETVSSVLNVTQLIVTPTWRQNGAEITCRGSNPYYKVRDRERR